MIKLFRNSIYILCIILALQGCSSGDNSEVSKLTGRIIWPQGNGNGNTVIYSVDTTSNLTQSEIYYDNDNYKKLYYPSKVKNMLLLVARKNSTSDYEILMLKGGNTESMLVKKDELLYPTAYDDMEIVYLGKNKEQSYLGLYSNNSKIDKKLFVGNIYVECKPAVASEGKILFVKIDDNKCMICLIDKDGNQRDVTGGRYPVWLDNGQQFIYYADDSIRKYDLESNKSEIIKRNICVSGTPVISPDKKFMAVFDNDSVALLGGETIDYLRILPLDGGKKVDVKAYLQAGRIYNWGGLEWIE